MLSDLTAMELQPISIDGKISEIVLSQPMRMKLQSIFDNEENFAKIDRATSIVKIDNNYVFFSNQWFYLAVLCKKYAQALYPYCVFFDEHIRNNSLIISDLANGRFDSEQYSNLFSSTQDREWMTKFIQGDSDFRPGKALINIRDGNKVAIRSCKDIFGSCVLKKISVPDASSGYLGNVIYYLAKNNDVFNDLKSEISKVIESSVETDVIAIPPEEQKKRFRMWLKSQKKANRELYSTNTIDTYIVQMERGYKEFNSYKDYPSVFSIQSVDEIGEYKEYLFNAEGFDKFNERAGNRSLSNGIIKYEQYLSDREVQQFELRFHTGLTSNYSRNRIVFGAPGTGKSFMINDDRKKLIGENNETDYERVTFHPDYSYANFVGTYKPVPCKDSDGKDAVTYEYVPGPFMRVYVNALRNGRTENVKPYLLVIEEINRANVAAVFGDAFQLLDRDENEVSEYPIQASEEIKKYLAKELGGEPDDYSKIKIPDNMFIWATMNSADQGVFPMDTAFKRRWDFTYIGIDDNDKNIQGKYVILGNESPQKVEWNKLRKAINHFLANQKINEDKQLGPYFISKKIVVPKNGDEIDKDAFVETFKNKVLMYLFEDAAKQKRATLFEGCCDNRSRYSEICKEFEEKGIGIFYHEVSIEAEPEAMTFNATTSESLEANKE